MTETLPEAGPLLGRMTDVTRRVADPALDLDRIRLELVSRVFEQVARARANPDDGALLAPEVWLGWWRGAVGQVVGRIETAHRERLLRAAARRRYRADRAQRLLPDAEAIGMVSARIDAAGIRLETLATEPRQASAALELRRWAVALDDAWDELEDLAAREYAALLPNVRRIEAWRPPNWPWLVAGGAIGAAVLWVALAIGGQVPRPAWLDPAADWFWSLPWP